MQHHIPRFPEDHAPPWSNTGPGPQRYFVYKDRIRMRTSIQRPNKKGIKPVSSPKKIDVETLPANGDMEQSGASVDKIRDILFGPQIKNYEARFVRLEETLARENAQIKDMMARRFESLEGFVKKETEALASRIKAERDERAEVARDIARDLKSATEALTKKIVELDNKTAEAQSGCVRTCSPSPAN